MTVTRSVRALLNHQGGSVGIMAGLLVTLLVPSVIAAVDLANIVSTKEKAQSRLDSAVLSASRIDDLQAASDSGRMQEIGERFILNELAVNGTRLENPETEFTFNSEDNIVRGTISFDAPSLFVGKVFKIDRIDLIAETRPREPVSLEVALSLDVSGSMGWSVTSNNPAPVGQRRIDILSEGVDGLIGVFNSNPLVDVRLSVVPYSSSVNLATVNTPANAGADKTDAETIDPNSVEATEDATWAVENVERNGAGEVELEEDTKRKIKQTVKEGTDAVTAAAENPAAVIDKETVAEEREKEEVKKVKTAPVGSPRAPVRPLSDPANISAYVKSIEPDGATAGHIGAEWALYSLLPDWQGTFKHDAPPAEFNGSTRKILIMMTDGDFTVTQTPDMNIDDAYDVFQDICETARDAGIIVYTVGLRASVKTDRELTDCAASEDRYFSVADRAQLLTAFTEIGEDATKLRISQ